MAAPYYLAIHGRLVVIGKEPDGDAVRFVADRPDPYAQLKHAHRIRPAADGSVRLRLEGVDAPELHYGPAAQPLAREARDQLLAWIGFTELEYAPPTATMVTAASPDAVPAVVLTQAAELHGRPVAYLVTSVGEDEHLPRTDSGRRSTGSCLTTASTPCWCRRVWPTRPSTPRRRSRTGRTCMSWPPRPARTARVSGPTTGPPSSPWRIRHRSGRRAS